MQEMGATRITCYEVTITSYFFDNFTALLFFNYNDNVITFFYNDNKFYSYFYRYFAHCKVSLRSSVPSTGTSSMMHAGERGRPDAKDLCQGRREDQIRVAV